MVDLDEVVEIKSCPEVNDFESLCKSDAYVDKTKFIIDFDSCCGVPQLIRLPRMFFKTMNLLSIKAFYEIEVDENGEKKHLKDRKNRKLFEDLFVAKNKTVWAKQGEYPVIFADFSSCVPEIFTRENIFDMFKEILSKLYDEHKYLEKSTILDELSIKIFKSYRLGKVDNNESMVIDGIARLCRLLSEHFKQRPIILVDDYNFAINEALEKADKL